MQNILTNLKARLLRWIFSEEAVTIGELHERLSAKAVKIPDHEGNLKFIEEAFPNELLVKAPTGYEPVKASRKTVPYQQYKLKLATGEELIGADHHIVMTVNGERRLIDLRPEELVLTETGSSVGKVTKLATSSVMYDIELDSAEHVYYTNGILSHNTTVIAAYLLWFACFRSEKYVLVASKDNDAAMDVLGRIQFSYEELPMWLKPGCLYFNRHEISFENGSTIKSTATTEKTGRGRSVSLLMIDELAFVSPQIQNAMWASLAPTLSTGGQCIISSTPNGDQELFAQLWRQGSVDTGDSGNFYPVFAPWYTHPDRGNGDETSLEALKYKASMIAKVGELMFKQEYSCEFLSSDPLLISSLISNSWVAEEPLYKDSGFSFWERIDPRKEYLVGCDVAEGLEKDYSTIEVFDIRLNQVAEFRSNKISEAEHYEKIKWIINYITSVKSQGSGVKAKLMWSYENNSCGKVISSLYYKDDKFPEDGELITVGERLGMNTNASTKKEASKDLKRLLESGAMKLKSKDLINEFKNYAQVGRSDGIYNAKAGSTDDLISACLITTRLFKYVTSYDDEAFDRLYRSKQGTGEERELDNDGGDIEPMPMAIL